MELKMYRNNLQRGYAPRQQGMLAEYA